VNRKDVKQFIAEYAADVKERRKGLGYSHDKLAEKSGVTRQGISKIEAGNGNPTITTMLKLADALGEDLSKIIAEIEKKNK
jgi:transcriptional regulator with XRE-family HTH domain